MGSPHRRRTLLYGALACLCPILAPDAGAQGWSTLAPLDEARQEVAVAELDGLAYVIGGFRSDGSIANTVEVYDPRSNSWSFAEPLPNPVHHAAAASVGGKLYVIGGWTDLFGVPLASTFEYDPDRDTWSPKTPMPTARASLAAAVLDGKIYVAGGSPPARERDFAVYDPALDRWTTLPDMPSPRNHLAAGAAGGRFYALGGRSGGLLGVSQAVEEFDPVSGAWETREPMPTARGGIAGATLGRHILVFGGEGNEGDPRGVFDEAEAYDTDADRWISLSPMPTGRHGIGAAMIAGRVHLPGGADQQLFGATAVHEVFDCAGICDTDGDEVLDGADNCLEVPNPGQEDFDAGQDDDTSLPGVQHYGDACDADLDNDGIVGASDFFGVFRPCLGVDPSLQPGCAPADLDGDGVIGASDLFGVLRPRIGTSPGPGSADLEP